MADLTHADLRRPHEPLDDDQLRELTGPYLPESDDVVIHAGDLFHPRSA